MEKNVLYKYKIVQGISIKNCAVVLERCSDDINFEKISLNCANTKNYFHNKAKESINCGRVIESLSHSLITISDHINKDMSSEDNMNIKESKDSPKNVSVSKKRQSFRKRKRISKILEEENSTNSDISDNNGLYDEINWEENLEVDTTALLDEFAPRPPATSPSSEKAMDTTSNFDEANIPSSTLEQDLLGVLEDGKDAHEFVPGSEVHVKDYNSSEWYLASVVEVDWDEEEVLVHFNDNLKSDEWVSMSSQRLSHNKPLPTRTVIETTIPIPEPLLHTSDNSGEEGQQLKKSLEKRSMGKIPRRMSRKKFQRFQRHSKKGVRSSSGKINSSKAQVRDRYFEVGEKVLAKWSDHRMQKFPAVIKRVLGNGTYDVLFYDGFEKTLGKDDLFKTTEEEIEKYQKSNPSEADSFVDMDIGSKEERRRRKKKTFDDYFFGNIFERSRKKSNILQGNLERMSHFKSGKGSDSGDINANLKNQKVQNLSAQGKQIKRKRGFSQESSSNKEKVAKREDSGVSEKLSEKTSDKNIENSACEYSSEHTLSAETSMSMEEGNETKKVPVSQLRTDGERWIGDISNDTLPTVISGIDGIPRKTVIVPDKNILTGWTKHAVKRQTGGNWEAFLVSPEGYRFHSLQKLKDFFRFNYFSDPPEVLDFKLCLRAIPELVLKQKDLSAKGTYQKWERKRGGRQRKSSSDSTSVPRMRKQFGRVKTLLPKHRIPAWSQEEPVVPGSLVPTENEVWKCPKKGCDKIFRNENLLQMHMKHYHVEFKALVRTAPKVEDLAYARTESANSDWRVEQNKPVQTTVKRIVPKQGSRGSFSEKIHERQEPERSLIPTHLSSSSMSQSQMLPVSKTDTLPSGDSSVSHILMPTEDKKTTIKTMLPLRQSNIEAPIKSIEETDNGESGDDSHSEAPKSYFNSRAYKQIRQKKIKIEPKYSPFGGAMDEVGIRDLGYPTHSTTRFVRKKQVSALEKLQITTDSNDSFTEEEKMSPNIEYHEERPRQIERLKSEELINCTCGFKEEDGLMIQCDVCLCWQHGLCNGIEKEIEVPDRYVCYICQNPYRVRSSKKYSYAQLYLTQAKLPTLSFRTSKEEDIKQRESMLNRCYDISANLHQIQNVERSLRAKINIASQSDHPKLYLWANNWDDNANVTVVEGRGRGDEKEELKDKEESSVGDNAENEVKAPIPEAAIDLEECRLKLMDHIELCQQQVESRLTTIEAQIAALESQDPDLASQETNENYPHTKQTVHMLLRDLATIRKLASIS